MVELKPQSIEEVKNLIDAGDMEVWVQEDLDDGTTRLLVCDNRSTYANIYEIIV